MYCVYLIGEGIRVVKICILITGCKSRILKIDIKVLIIVPK